MTADDLLALRTRLLALRCDALDQLAAADVLDGGLVALVAHASQALMALDAEVERRACEIPRRAGAQGRAVSGREGESGSRQSAHWTGSTG